MSSAYMTERQKEMLTAAITAIQADWMEKWKLTETQVLIEMANTLMHLSIGTFQQIAIKNTFQQMNKEEIQ